MNKTYIDNLNNLESNCGYLINRRKMFGKKPQVYVDNFMCIVEPDTRHIHVWTRRNYKKLKLNDDESINDGFNLNVIRETIEEHDMYICKSELENKGECSLRFDSTHMKNFYHFATFDFASSSVLLSANNKPICRYHLHGDRICWEADNVAHNKFFDHV
jgi:hypothetical protein